MASNCLQHLYIASEALTTIHNEESLDNQQRLAYNDLCTQYAQSYTILQCLRDSLQQLDDLSLPSRLVVDDVPINLDSLSSGVPLPVDAHNTSEEPEPKEVTKKTEEDSGGKSSEVSAESLSESERPVNYLPASLRSKPRTASSPRSPTSEDEEGTNLS
jgi:hypothetical protein